jgi:hypothetical protein
MHNDELHSLYPSPNIVRVIKSRRMRWAEHVACMREGKNVYRVLVGRPKRKRPWEDSGVEGKIILRWTLGRQWLMGHTGFGWLRTESSGKFLSTQ